MVVWSLVMSLAAVLQVAQAYPKPGRPQFGPFGKHGGVATEVRAHNPQSFSPEFLCRAIIRVDRWRNVRRSESICLFEVEARSML